MRALLRIALFFFIASGMVAQQPENSTAMATGDFEISGTVVNALSGAPMSQARVMITTITPVRRPVRSVTTGEDGRFLFRNLVAGKYSLLAAHKGFPQQALDEHEGFSTAVAVGPGKESDHIVFRLKPDGSISGSVVDEAGEAVRNAQVMLFRTSVEGGERQTRRLMQNSTDDRGAYRFNYLRPGTYYVAVSAQPWYAQNNPKLSENTKDVNPPSSNNGNDPLDVAYPITFYPQAYSLDGATPIPLQRGDRLIADIALAPVPALHLRVLNVSSDPSQNTQVTFKQPLADGMETVMHTQVTRTYTNSVSTTASASVKIPPGSEIIEITGIAPGHYEMDLQNFDQKNQGNSPSVRQKIVDLSDDGEIDAAETTTSATVSGAVQVEGGALPPEASILLQSRESHQGYGNTISAEGKFDPVMLSPGHYGISLGNAPGFFIKNISATGAKVIGQTLEVKGSNPVQLTVVATKGMGRVDGIALRSGKPAAGVMIVLVPPDPANNRSLFRRDQSDSDGTFTLPAVLPGAYTVVAIENGWEMEWMNPGILQPYLARGEVIQVQPNGKYNIKVAAQ